MHIEMSLHPKVKRSATQLFDMNFDKPYEGGAEQLANKYLVETSIDDFLIPQLEGKPTLQRSHPASQVDGAKVLGREHANLYNPSLRVGTGNPNDMYYEGLMSDEDLNKRVNSHLQYLI